MRVLVTGGAGYIGSHTAKVLARRGHDPIVLDDLSTGHLRSVRWGPMVDGDVGDSAVLGAVFAEHRPEAVIHFAGSALVPESMRRPELYFRNNSLATARLLDAVLESGPIPFVFSSTCATYGVPEQVPIPDDHPQLPVNPYGESKLFIERMLRWYGDLHGLPWMALRYFNAAGADPDGELGEDHDPETHLIPRVVGAVLGRFPSIEIFGTDYPTPDGTAVRDYIHVTDLADAHLKAVAVLAGGGPSGAYNVGTGAGSSVREVVAMVGRVSGRDVPVVEGPRRAGDPPELVADPSGVQEALGWNPVMSDLETVVATAWRWHSQSAP